MIVSNQIKCRKCGDEIFSAHVHDFVTCSCSAVSVDGGCEYLRRVGTEYDEMSICMPKEVVDTCIEAWGRHESALYVCGVLHNYCGLRLEQVDGDKVDAAITWGREIGRNSRGIVYAIFRALRDSGVDLNKYEE